MDLIPSFAVDHTKIVPGIYVSRVDNIAGQEVTTYDIRMKFPNQEPAVNPAAMHSIEHLVATFLRNDPFWKDQLVYWGPMGCMTGCYMITKSRLDCEKIRDGLMNAMQFVLDYEGEVPGTDITQCGNHLMHDLPMAKWECRQYLQRLTEAFCCEYPTIERKTTKEGAQFFDA